MEKDWDANALGSSGLCKQGRRWFICDVGGVRGAIEDRITRKTRASHDDPLRSRQPDADDNHSEAQNPDIHVTDTADPIANTTAALYERQIHAPNSVPIPPSPRDDPLVYWGYLVKNQFMAGELYSLSWSIVKWVAKDLTVKGLTRGKEDKQVAKWMRIHPRHSEVRWKSERCWIYDHPRAGTV